GPCRSLCLAQRSAARGAGWLRHRPGFPLGAAADRTGSRSPGARHAVFRRRPPAGRAMDGAAPAAGLRGIPPGGAGTRRPRGIGIADCAAQPAARAAPHRSSGSGRSGPRRRGAARLKPAQRKALFRRLQELNPQPTTELLFRSPFELLVAVMLSAQATDVSVNKATRGLFAAAPDPAAMLALGEEGVKRHISSIGLFNTKAR